jgi:glycine/D-amino acid oxidase-like deaminating enzyme
MYAAVGIGGGYHADTDSIRDLNKIENMKKNNLSICVIGAGTVGLSNAWRIMKDLSETSQVKVTIISEKFYNETTSYGSGGLWEPYQILGTPDDKINEWGKDAFDHFLELYNSPYGAEAGIQLLTAYNLLEENQELIIPSWKDIVFNFQVLTNDDLQKMSLPKRFVKGFTFGTLVIDQKYYMRYMTKELHKMGVKFIQQKVDKIEELFDKKYDAIINCTGLGSYTLLEDSLMYPIRGQVLRVKALLFIN